jgi:hypothetical protein
MEFSSCPGTLLGLTPARALRATNSAQDDKVEYDSILGARVGGAFWVGAVVVAAVFVFVGYVYVGFG